MCRSSGTSHSAAIVRKAELFAGDRRLCDALDVPFSGPEAIARVTTDVPILLISSGYDAQTPSRFAEATVGSLRHGYHVVFPMAGHIATVRPPAMACAAIVIESFLAHTDRAPSTECVSAVGPMFSARPSVATPKVPQVTRSRRSCRDCEFHPSSRAFLSQWSNAARRGMAFCHVRYASGVGDVPRA